MDFSKVKITEWQPFGKERLISLTAQYSQRDVYISRVRVKTKKKDCVPRILQAISKLVAGDHSFFTLSHTRFTFRKKIDAHQKNHYWLKHVDNPFHVIVNPFHTKVESFHACFPCSTQNSRYLLPNSTQKKSYDRQKNST